jgi:hypothetical protein
MGSENIIVLKTSINDGAEMHSSQKKIVLTFFSFLTAMLLFFWLLFFFFLFEDLYDASYLNPCCLEDFLNVC